MQNRIYNGIFLLIECVTALKKKNHLPTEYKNLILVVEAIYSAITFPSLHHDTSYTIRTDNFF